jgi:hypothetical protein
VLGVEDHRHVEAAHDLLGGNLVEDHLEEVRGVAEVLRRGDGIEAVTTTVVDGHDRRQLRVETLRLGEVRLGTLDVGFGIDGAEVGHRRLHDVHWVAVLGQVEDELDELVVDLALGVLTGLELLELRLGRQFAVPDEVGDVLEAALRGKFLDGVAAVGQRVGLLDHFGHGRGVDDDAGEALFDFFGHW